MAQQSQTEAQRSRTLATVARLVTLADGDTVYRDVYLRRAEDLLSPLINRDRFTGALAGREQHARLLGQARAAVARQDWASVHELGARAAGLQSALAADQEELAAAESVYAAPSIVLDPLSPGLASGRWSRPAQAHAELRAALAELVREDPDRKALYAARQRALDAVPLPGAAPAESATAAAPTGNVEQQALQALERGDAAALQRLAESMLGRRAAAAPSDEPATVARAGIVVPPVLGEPLPDACLPRAKDLGFEPVETTLAGVAGSVIDFIERYAVGASPAAFDRAKDGVVQLEVAAREMAIPPDVAAVFAESVSLFALHLFVNSAGVRLVPVPAPREVLLVEAHAEGEEPVTPLLRELGLERRRALARDEIEDALQRHGARLVADRLGLDPLEFRIVCVPGDVYVRVGRERGWGQRPQWTHFDGYQVVKGGRLRALVGGNAAFGGLVEFCSIGRDDGRENTVARFAVIRRERLGVRIV